MFPTYFFSIQESDFKDIESGKADLNVTLLFPNSVDRKKGVILINDYFMEIETFESFYNRGINSFVREGNNAVEIRPKSDKIDILELKVVMAE